MGIYLLVSSRTAAVPKYQVTKRGISRDRSADCATAPDEACAAQAHRVAEENRRLMRLITLLTVNKGSFEMLPQLPASARSQGAPAQDGNDGAASAGLSGQGEPCIP